MEKNNPKPILIVDAVVGAGKTTLATIISKKTGLKLYEELCNQDTFGLLDRFYADQERWAFTLQIHFLNERFRMIKEIHRNGGGLLDRSIFGDKIFAEMLCEDGKMSPEEYRTYSTLLDNMLEHALPPTLLIYLRCDVDTAIERIAKRNRGSESSVPRRYWERLNEKYNQWYGKYDLSPKFEINAREFDPSDESHIRDVVARMEETLKPGHR